MSTPGIPAVRAVQNPQLGLAPSSDAALINEYISARYPSSPLVGHGQDFVDAVNTYAPHTGSAPLLAAIAVQESGAGTAGRGASGNNPFNLGPGLTYPSIRAGIFAAAAAIAHRDPTGWDPVNIGPWYAPQSAGNDTQAWIRGVELITTQIQKSVPPSGPQGGKSGPNSPPFSGPGPGGTDAGVAKPVNPFSAITDPLSAVVAALGWLTNTHNWLRVGEMALGAGALGLGVWSLVKGRAGLAVLLGGGGYLFLYSGVRDISPIREFQDAFTPGKAASSSGAGSRG